MIKLKYTLKNGQEIITNTIWKSFKEIIEWSEENNFKYTGNEDDIILNVNDRNYLYIYSI